MLEIRLCLLKLKNIKKNYLCIIYFWLCRVFVAVRGLSLLSSCMCRLLMSKLPGSRAQAQ